MRPSVHPKAETVVGRQFGSKRLSHEVRTSVLDTYDVVSNNLT